MLMFVFHITIALGLMALTFALFLHHKCKYGCCCKSQQCESTGGQACSGKKCGSICSMIIVILALISLLMTYSVGYKLFKAGEFHMPAPMVTEETIQMNAQ